jgi:hypothetical protein
MKLRRKPHGRADAADSSGASQPAPPPPSRGGRGLGHAASMNAEEREGLRRLVDRERSRELLVQALRFEVSELRVEAVAAMAARAGIDRARSRLARRVVAPRRGHPLPSADSRFRPSFHDHDHALHLLTAGDEAHRTITRSRWCDSRSAAGC